MRMTYSTDLREKAMEFLEKGHSIGQAEEAFGCSGTAVFKALKRLKITRKKKRGGSGSRSRSR